MKLGDCVLDIMKVMAELEIISIFFIRGIAIKKIENMDIFNSLLVLYYVPSTDFKLQWTLY